MSHQQEPLISDAAPAPSGERLGLWPAILLGLLCQVLVIVWIVYSEIPGKVFISSWSVSMPGILLLAVLGCARAWPRLTFTFLLALAALWNLYLAVTAGSFLTPFGAASLLALGFTAWAAGRPGFRQSIRGVLGRRTLLTAYIMVAVSGVLTGYSCI